MRCGDAPPHSVFSLALTRSPDGIDDNEDLKIPSQKDEIPFVRGKGIRLNDVDIQDKDWNRLRYPFIR